MSFTFHPLKTTGAGETSRIAKELHKLLDERTLEKYASFVIEEARLGRNVVLELMIDAEKPYVIRIFDSTRDYDKDARVSLVVCYRSGRELEEAGLISIPSMFCAQTEGDI